MQGRPLQLDESLRLIVGLVRLFQPDVITPPQGTHDLDFQMKTITVPARGRPLRQGALNMSRAPPPRFLPDAPHRQFIQTG